MKMITKTIIMQHRLLSLRVEHFWYILLQIYRIDVNVNNRLGFSEVQGPVDYVSCQKEALHAELPVIQPRGFYDMVCKVTDDRPNAILSLFWSAESCATANGVTQSDLDYATLRDPFVCVLIPAVDPVSVLLEPVKQSPASLVSSVIRRRVNMPKVTAQENRAPWLFFPTMWDSVPLDQRPGVVYKITCGCNASYIGETGNTLFHRFKQHRDGVNSYRKALKEVAGTEPTQNDQNRPPTPDGRVPEDIPQRRGRGRPRKKPAKTVTKKRDARKTMANAIKGSAVVEHSSQCSLDLRPKIICRESLFSLRKLKEAFYIRHNAPSMSRNKGVEVSEAWAGLIDQTGCCALAP
ncbi:hypothetical protein M513_08441 [Trichuris suis]|uniref:GIY-YIG domain-containing protein n=1 Tax=Trichuris suis TaxID=68888 RepID=A0A085M088_9BILA|nr:hypothetical protein M513_08441 [Trichuris suis]